MNSNASAEMTIWNCWMTATTISETKRAGVRTGPLLNLGIQNLQNRRYEKCNSDITAAFKFQRHT